MYTRFSEGSRIVFRRVVRASKGSFHTSLPQHDSAPFAFRPLFGLDELPSSFPPRSRSAPLETVASKASSDQQHSREPKANSLASSYPRPNKRNRLTFGDISRSQAQTRLPSKLKEATRPQSPVSSYRNRDKFSHFEGAVSTQPAPSKRKNSGQFNLESTQNESQDAARNRNRDSSGGSYEHIRLPQDDLDDHSNTSFRSKRTSKTSRNQHTIMKPADSSSWSKESRRFPSQDQVRPAKLSDLTLSKSALEESLEPVATRTRPSLSSSRPTRFADSPSVSSYEYHPRDHPSTVTPDVQVVLGGTTLGHLTASQTATAEEQKALSDLEAILKEQDESQRRKIRKPFKRQKGRDGNQEGSRGERKA